jgi:hypothetical protein
MTKAIWRKLLPIAALLAALQATAVHAEHLNMNMENNTDTELKYVSGKGVGTSPPTIAAGASEIVESVETSEGTVGAFVYASETCYAELLFSFIVSSGKCDDKNFTPNTKLNCQIVKTDSCGGDNNCDCHFSINAK